MREYLATLDEAAWGAATDVKPKFVSPSDPAAQWTGALRGPAFERVTAMARVIPVYRFTRPRDYAAFDEGAALLMKEFGRS